jgi:hypothetical protein
MRVISASRRTDIPAFYSDWLLNRLNAGFCHWLNPFGGQVYRVSLRPEDVLAIVFWTRNPKPLLPHLSELRRRGYQFYFHVTINGYPAPFETHSPPLPQAVAAFQRLSDAISPDLIFWRYDPIIFSDQTPPAYHITQFDALSRQLQGYAKRCYFSFVDIYGKTARNMKQSGLAIQQPAPQVQRDLVQALCQIAETRGITLYSCCETALVGAQPPYPPTLGEIATTTLTQTSGPGGSGVQQAHCIDLDIVRLLRRDLALRIKAAPSRQGCGCIAAADIGAYDTCIFGCAYCYATNSRQAALQRMKEHDPDDSLLWRPASLRGEDLTRV